MSMLMQHISWRTLLLMGLLAWVIALVVMRMNAYA